MGLDGDCHESLPSLVRIQYGNYRGVTYSEDADLGDIVENDRGAHWRNGLPRIASILSAEVSLSVNFR